MARGGGPAAAWARIRWAVLPATGLAAVVLGTWGFARVDAADGDQQTLLTHLYQSFSLFGAQGADIDGVVPWPLEVARFLAPLVVAGAAIGAAMAVFRRQVDALRVRLLRDHLIVIGAGPRAQALAASSHPRRTGRRRAVLVDVTGEPSTIGAARAGRHLVIEAGTMASSGDAAAALRRAGIARAEVVVSLSGELGIEARVAAAVVQMAGEGEAPRRLGSFIEVGDIEIARQLETQPDSDHRHAGQEFFNAADRGARALVAELDLGEPLEVLVVGDGDQAMMVAVHLARRLATDPGRTPGASHLTVAHVSSATDDGAADALRRRLERWYPPLRDGSRIASTVISVSPDDLRVGGTTPDVALVAMDDDAAGAHVALGLLTTLPDDTPMVLLSPTDASVGALIGGSGPRLRMVSVDELVLREDAIRAGSIEAMARATHESYRRDGHDAPPWSALDDAAREDNRRPVRELWAELARHGYRVVAHTDPDAEHDRWDDDPRGAEGRSIRETLARAEHQRWFTQRTEEGYTWGPEPGPRTKPCLRPWESPDLPDPCRASTYQQIDDIPRALAAAGLQLRPRPHDHAGPPGTGSTS